jgi:phosphonoacetate hydrolase
MPPARATTFTANDRDYTVGPQPIAVICLDGCEPDYLTEASKAGATPHLDTFKTNGHHSLCTGCLPSYTNVNNSAIVTGTPPSVHGIAGNFFLDPDTGNEVMMNSPEFLRVPTLFPAAEAAGRRIAVLTSKDKLRTILRHELKNPIAFSAEKANEATQETHGLSDAEALLGQPTPSVYSAEASTLVIGAGAALIEQDRADFLYLSTTDYIQHKHAPKDPTAIAFHAELDKQIGRLLQAGAIVGLTADHGMNAKTNPDGTPKVLFLETILTESHDPEIRVILPITDPYVVHHGALGSFAVVHLPAGTDAEATQAIQETLQALPGITEVLPRSEAATQLELPPDRIGDLVVLADASTVLGRRPELHDLSAVTQGLRSHGGRHETTIPFLISHPLPANYPTTNLRNFDLFEATCAASHLAAHPA